MATPPTECCFCNKPEVAYALFDWAIYRPACRGCTVERMGEYKEIVDALAIWPIPRENRGD